MRAEAPAQGALRGFGSVHGEGGEEELSGRGRVSRENAAFASECARGGRGASGRRAFAGGDDGRKKVGGFVWRVVVSRSGRRLNTWNLSSGAAELELRVGQGTCASSAVSSLCDAETTGANWAV